MAVLLGPTAFQQYMTHCWRTSLSSVSALRGAVQIILLVSDRGSPLLETDKQRGENGAQNDEKKRSGKKESQEVALYPGLQS